MNVLAVLCLGVLVSCSQSEPEGPAPAGSLERRADALTTVDVPRLTWTGGQSNCINCRGLNEYQCWGSSGDGAKTFTDPVPTGRSVVGITTKVVGRLLNKAGTVDVFLNGTKLGSYTEVAGACDQACPAEQTIPVSNLAQNVYNHGGNNTLTFATPSGSVYCVSHADITLTTTAPTIEIVTPAPPATLDFGNQKVGTPGTKMVEIKNVGDAPLTVSALTIDAPFKLNTNPPLTLAAGETSFISVTFTPTAEVGVQGTLGIASNDPANPTVDVTLAGNGVAYAFDVSATSLTFDAQRVDTSSTAQTVTVTNVGSDPLTIDSVAIGANQPFTVSPDTSFQLAAGAQQVLSVVFTPTVAGPASGTLTIGSDDPQRPEATVSLTGTGQKPTVSLDATSLDFAPQRVNTPSAAKTVTVTNTGDLE
ncbi:MAG: choice-of-anchor D domain-containing protein, partial [Myxococcaceae bacterium]|nr:choice-of-anchor D domain-containing protein [Myxococcaceae bacterium]